MEPGLHLFSILHLLILSPPILFCPFLFLNQASPVWALVVFHHELLP